MKIFEVQTAKITNFIAAVQLLFLIAASANAHFCKIEVSDTKANIFAGAGSPAVKLTILAGAHGEPADSNFPEFIQIFGAGSRYTWKIEPQKGLKGEIFLSFIKEKGIVLVGGNLKNVSDEPIYVESLPLCRIAISRPDIRDSRLFINSGFQAPSGSFAVSDPNSLRLRCTAV